MPHTSFDRHILLIIDTETLLSDCPDPSLSADAPSVVDARYLFVQGARPAHWQGQDKQPLHLTALAGDPLFFRSAPVALRGENILFLQEIRGQANAVMAPPQAALRSGALIARPHFANPLQLESPALDDYYLTTRLNAPGAGRQRFALRCSTAVA